MQRLSVRASLDDSPAALANAEAHAAAGDESWEQWVEEYRRGEALIVRLELTVEIDGAGGDILTASTSGYFVENDAHAPKLEQQIAELAADDLGELATQLVERGHDLDLHALASMYVHVELAPEVLERVHDRGNSA